MYDELIKVLISFMKTGIPPEMLTLRDAHSTTVKKKL